MATSVLSFTQDYKKTVVEGKEWQITLQTGMGGTLTHCYHISCDTIIDDQVYYQVIS